MRALEFGSVEEPIGAAAMDRLTGDPRVHDLEHMIVMQSETIADMKARGQCAEKPERLIGILQSCLHIVRICTAIAAEKVAAVQQQQGPQ